MAMYNDNFQIGEYRVGFVQLPQTQRPLYQVERHIILWPHSSYSGTKVAVVLDFFRNYTGWTGSDSVTHLIVGYPSEDFEAIYQMLRAERYCYFAWGSDNSPGPNTQVIWCRLDHVEVPPGGLP
jgi:hypothetical protein